jgi:hypothetical protein
VSEDPLRAALEERNRLWEQLQAREARDLELEYWRERATAMEASLSWRLTAPLRLVQRVLEDPAEALRILVWKLTTWQRD